MRQVDGYASGGREMLEGLTAEPRRRQIRQQPAGRDVESTTKCVEGRDEIPLLMLGKILKRIWP